MRVKIATFATFVLASGAFATGGHAAPTKSPVKIGALVCQTGPVATAYLPAVAVTKAWAASVNAADGLNGHPIELDVRDDGCDAAKSSAAVRSLVEDKVIAILSSTAVETAFADYLDKMKVPAISGASTFGSAWNDHPMMFPVTTTHPYTQYAQIVTAKYAGATKVAGLICAEAPACKALEPPFREQAARSGVEVVAFMPTPAAQPQFTAECLQIRASGADYVHVALVILVAKRAIQDCIRQGVNPIWASPGTSFDAAYLDIPGLNMFSGQLAFPFYVDDPATKEFRDVLKKYGNAEPKTPSEAGVWTGIKLLEAATKNLPADPTPADVLKGLYALDGDTLGGLASQPLKFVEGAKTNGPIKCFFLGAIKGGKFTAPQGLKPVCLD